MLLKSCLMVIASLNKLKSALPVLKDIATGISKKAANPPVIIDK